MKSGSSSQTVTVYFPETDEELDIDVECEYEVCNDGIGAYEYWGQKCYDAGTDRLTIISTSWDKTGFSPDQIKTIEEKISNSIPDWEGEIWTE